jgi:glycerol-3-phosphate O-acyltransferase
MRYVEKKPYTEKDFVKKILAAGEKNLKLELIERPESVSKIVCRNALTYYVEKGLLERRAHEVKGRDKTVEKFEFVGDRQLVQYYGRQISRLLRAPHLALQ